MKSPILSAFSFIILFFSYMHNIFSYFIYFLTILSFYQTKTERLYSRRTISFFSLPIDLFFQSGYVGLGNTKHIRNLFLGFFLSIDGI